jgi:formylglycine-generating enzyme required for sulfatase activity
MTDCLAGDAGTESCCTSPEVVGGTFFELYANTGGGPVGGADPASVSGLRLDKYLVTVGRFRQYVSAWDNGKGYLPAVGSGKHAHLNGGQGLVNSGAIGGYESGWQASWNGDVTPTNASLAGGTWTTTPGAHENLPITYVNWYEAYAFCIWDGGFLPSEAEWEYAAAGGSQERAYPWGSTDPGTASQYAIYGCYYPDPASNCIDTLPEVAPVGTPWLGAGRWGQVDLVGEVWEWDLDWYGGPGGPCVDCACLTGGSSRVLEGCMDSCPAEGLRPPDSLEGSDPTVLDFDSGFRCARSP